MVSKQLQYIYCPISHKVKTTGQWNWVDRQNIPKESFFFKVHEENEASRLVPDAFFVSGKLR